ncbi:MAG: DUF1735 domain-containing protein [Sphingobacteriales bacterium]|nr:DUF1735 domain-containing protein [Sphingobacteriales bacterium]
MKMNIKKIVPVFLLITIAASFSSCIKDANAGTEVVGLKPTVLIVEGGMGQFSHQSLLFPGSETIDSMTFHLNYAATDVAPADINITLGIDAAALTAYNTANPTQTYAIFPDSTFSFKSTSVTIKKGQSYSNDIQVYFYPNKMDYGKNLMLPISIKDGAGNNLSSNFNTLYYHLIGNPYAGNYTATGYFYHPSSPRAISRQKSASPLNSVDFSIELGDLGGNGYIAIFTTDPVTHAVTITAAPGAGGAPYTMFSNGLPTDSPGYTAGWSGSSMCNNTYDPVTKTFYVRYGYMGGSGWRVTEEIIKKN